MVFRPRNPAFVGAASGAVPDQVSGQDSTANSTSQITVSWNAVTAIPAVTSYTVQWSANGSSNWADIGETVGNVTSIADASLSTYTTYYYRIKANNAMGSGAYSSNTSETTAGVLPNQVTGLTVTLNGANVDLAWNVPSFGTPNTGTYTVQRSTSSGSGFSDIVSSHGSNSYTNSSPTVDYTYYYRVKAVNAFGSGSYSTEGSVFVPSPSYGLICGGTVQFGSKNEIMYIAIHTSGDATDYGDLTHGDGSNMFGMASTTRGYVGGGYGGIAYNKNQRNIDVMTIASTGSASDWGDMAIGHSDINAASNNTYGCVFGGRTNINSGNGSTMTTAIDRISVGGTSGSGSDYGDMSGTWGNGAGNIRNGSIWVFGLAQRGATNTARMDTNSFTSASTASDFGDLLTSDYRTGAGLSNSTRGVFHGGQGGSPYYYNVMQYITTATASDSTDYGDLTTGRRAAHGIANATNGISIGGAPATLSMEKFTIATGGSTTDWGDQVKNHESGGACSHY